MLFQANLIQNMCLNVRGIYGFPTDDLFTSLCIKNRVAPLSDIVRLYTPQRSGFCLLQHIQKHVCLPYKALFTDTMS